jgi:hypothetical protein
MTVAESDSKIGREAKGKAHEMIWQESSELHLSILYSALEFCQFRMADGD